MSPELVFLIKRRIYLSDVAHMCPALASKRSLALGRETDSCAHE